MTTWIKLEDGFPEHVDVIGLPDSAFRSFIQGVCYASRSTSDGWIPKAAAKVVLVKPRDAQALVDAGLWVERTEGWFIVNYLKHQRSAEQIAAERGKNRARKQRQRDTAGNPAPVTVGHLRESVGKAS